MTIDLKADPTIGMTQSASILAGGDILINPLVPAKGNVSITGGANGAQAQISAGGNVIGNLLGTGMLGNYILQSAGPSVPMLPNFSASITAEGAGNLILTGGNFLLDGTMGGSVAILNASFAGVQVLQLNAAESITLIGSSLNPAITSNILCAGFNGGEVDVTLTAGQNISLASATVANVFVNMGMGPMGGPSEMLLIAGTNISIDSLSVVENQVSGSLSLVVDNDFPAAPGIGPGAFSIASGGTLSIASGPLYIFTARRAQNMIDSMINGATFVPGPFGVDTAEEQWGVYYPDPPPPPVGFPFTIFYKEGGVPIPGVSFSTLQKASLLASQMAYWLAPENDYFLWCNDAILWGECFYVDNAITDHHVPYFIERARMRQ